MPREVSVTQMFFIILKDAVCFYFSPCHILWTNAIILNARPLTALMQCSASCWDWFECIFIKWMFYFNRRLEIVSLVHQRIVHNVTVAVRDIDKKYFIYLDLKALKAFLPWHQVTQPEWLNGFISIDLHSLLIFSIRSRRSSTLHLLNWLKSMEFSFT